MASIAVLSNGMASSAFARAVALHVDWEAVAVDIGSLSAAECEAAFCDCFMEPSFSAPVGDLNTSFSAPCVVEPAPKVHKPATSKISQSFAMVDPNKKRVRRKATQIKRLFQCVVSCCPKSYGTEGALKMHLKLKHPEVDYDPMNPPVVVDPSLLNSASTSKRNSRRRSSDEDDSSASSIDELMPLSPSSPRSGSAPHSPNPTQTFADVKKEPTPTALPSMGALLPPMGPVAPQSVFMGQPPFSQMPLPTMYAPGPAYQLRPMPMPDARFMPPQWTPTMIPGLSVAPMDPKKRPSPVQCEPPSKRLKADDTDAVATLMQMKSQC